ncbi:hypothetical protein [Methylobacterium sp. WL120]|uniref:hypothetical protein n=1 Tax=Methylobacterium sp. WL120 TaxID=2603887 RepID=UPI0011CC1222|nr:hypothetical protein [Methylobacterium sp. WL120]TXM69677.1 hypothetical protein FV229_04850 [Methylobacterium sp. WL120]
MPRPPFKSGTFNIERTCHESHRLNDRLMLGSSASREVALWWLEHHYRARYPQFTFELHGDAPATTCALPTSH